MDRRNILSILAIIAIGLASLLGKAVAQQHALKDQLAGTWLAISIESTAPDGTKRQLYGPSPKGFLLLDANGQFAQILVNPDIPKFKVNSRLKGTPEENAAVVHGTSAVFGTWTFDEATRMITINITASLLPNQAGMTNRRTVVSVTADELKIATGTTGSGLRNDQVWKRAK